MNSHRSLLLLSLLVNAVLAAGVVYFLRPAAPRVPSASPVRAVVTAPAVSAASSTAVAPAVIVITNRFQWRELESTNYEVFVANLRAVGCPEKTVRDLVLADLRAAFHARMRAESPAVPFWTGGRERARLEREGQERETRLSAEFAALAKRLLGVDWRPDDEIEDDLTNQALTRFIAGPLAEETFQRLAAILEKFDRIKTHLNDAEDGIVLPEDLERRRQARAQFQAELSAVLTPAQMDEFFARVNGVPDASPNLQREAMDVTPAEHRALCVLRSRHFDPLTEMMELEEPSEEEQTRAEAGFQAEVRAFLGDARFADFERSQDDDFRSLYRVAAEDLGRAAVVKAHEVSRLAHSEAERLAADPVLDAADRQQRLAQVTALTEAELRRLLGEKVYRQCREAKLELLPEVKP